MYGNLLKAILLCNSNSEEEAYAFAHQQEEEELMEIYREAYGSTSGKHDGSVVGRKYINHNQQAFHRTLLQDYFARDPTYSPEMFRRRFRMSHPLFLRILESIQQNNYYFVYKQDAAKKKGLSGHQKMTAALRMLAYGTPVDALDDAYRIVESTTLENLDHFCQSVVEIYETEYLRSPNEADVTRLREMHESKGWPGMLGSLDCMHWEWKNFLKAFHEAYNDKEKN